MIPHDRRLHHKFLHNNRLNNIRLLKRFLYGNLYKTPVDICRVIILITLLAQVQEGKRTFAKVNDAFANILETYCYYVKPTSNERR